MADFPERLWIAVQTRNAEMSRKFGDAQLGGMSQCPKKAVDLFGRQRHFAVEPIRAGAS